MSELPDRYRAEVDDPVAAFGKDTVLLAWKDGTPVGCLAVTSPELGRSELKRLYVFPVARGVGLASELVECGVAEASRMGASVVGLSVWSWRKAAIGLYERLGFKVVPSWDDRPDLVCLERPI
ncbi:GNAT family N-acetyltransferase [Kribbella deserti]|uniref:GNAT family N-acetyltransferase n=1 Tax=Kribbella deserti TaxID=1926257 RepID=A0ABV6QLP1_9ACTN